MAVPGLQIDHDSSVPVYRQIADGVQAAALGGRLEPGRRLPPTRDLARQLGVNRQTVVAAYEHLAAEGWVHSRTGKGTFLAESRAIVGPGAARDGSPSEDSGWLSSFSRAVDGPNVGGLLSVYRMANQSDGISFAGSYPSRELMPVEAFGRSMASTLREMGPEVLSYGPTAGHLPLRSLRSSFAPARRSGASGQGS